MVVCHCLLTALLFDTNINIIARWRQKGTGCIRKSWPRISVYSWIFERRSETEKLPAVLKGKENFFYKENVEQSCKGIKRDLKTKKNSWFWTICREKLYSLIRSYRNYIAEKKKTRNKKMKPFLHESEMYELLHDNPGLNSPLLKSSLRASLWKRRTVKRIHAQRKIPQRRGNVVMSPQNISRKGMRLPKCIEGNTWETK